MYSLRTRTFVFHLSWRWCSLSLSFPTFGLEHIHSIQIKGTKKVITHALSVTCSFFLFFFFSVFLMNMTTPYIGWIRKRNVLVSHIPLWIRNQHAFQFWNHQRFHLNGVQINMIDNHQGLSYHCTFLPQTLSIQVPSLQQTLRITHGVEWLHRIKQAYTLQVCSLPLHDEQRFQWLLAEPWKGWTKEGSGSRKERTESLPPTWLPQELYLHPHVPKRAFLPVPSPSWRSELEDKEDQAIRTNGVRHTPSGTNFVLEVNLWLVPRHIQLELTDVEDLSVQSPQHKDGNGRSNHPTRPPKV